MNKPDFLYLRYAINDLTKNKSVTLALGVLLVLGAFLMATGAMVMERSLAAVDQLFEEAKPPHFLQMHQGTYDPQALDRFAAKHPEISAWLVEDMLGFDGAAIGWERPTTGESGDLAESLIDNLFVTQNRDFDFLIDSRGKNPRPFPGEIYVPVAYEQQFGLQTGDTLAVATDSGIHELRIQGFIRDAQMGSSLSSATRFLISEADFLELEEAGGGAAEIIVEYRLTDLSMLSALQRAYESDLALPKNGQGVTFEMIRLVNAFSDGLVAVAFVFASLILVAIALLNVRFVIRGTLEEQIREIGVMKAIGLPEKAITGLHLHKYSIMTFLACLIGGALAVIATKLLLNGGYTAAPGPASVLVPVAALVMLYLFVIMICRNVLKSVRKIEVVGALVHGSTRGEKRTASLARRRAAQVRRSGIASLRPGSLKGRLLLVDLRADIGQWVLITVVFFLAAIMMTLPMNLLSTFQSPRFLTYMGAPVSDLRIDLQFSDDVDGLRERVLAGLQSDDRVAEVQTFANVLYEAEGAQGPQSLRVEVGDYTHRSDEFVHGGRPEPGQIALSVLNAQSFGLAIGDELEIARAGQRETLTVSGIYQDVTSSGYTAKMQGEQEAGAAGYVMYANIAPEVDPGALAADYEARYPAASVLPLQEYMRQTLGYVTGALGKAAIVSFAFGTGVAVLITAMFLKLRVVRERRTMGILSVIGFPRGEIIAQLRIKAVLMAAVGTALGLIATASAGQWVVGLMISGTGLGLVELTFIPNPWLVYLLYPMVLMAAGFLGAVLPTHPLRTADSGTWLRG